jgi:hypothetical protein
VDVQVFISWSDEPSRTIAGALYDWLPAVVQHVQPWMSVEDIQSGSRWSNEVSAALDATSVGIICVTAANQHKPWLIFEAGALAKRLGDEPGVVVPLCIDLKPTDISGPLSTFQGRTLNREGMQRLVYELMGRRENAPANAKEQTTRLFQAMWPELEAQVEEAKQLSPDVDVPLRRPDEILEELLERVRRIDNAYSRLTTPVDRARTATDTASPSDYVVRPHSIVNFEAGSSPALVTFGAPEGTLLKQFVEQESGSESAD